MSYAELQQQVTREFPSYREVRKVDSWLMKAIDRCLWVITLGRMRSFMQDFITTLGTTVYVPESWGSMLEHEKMIILRHERVHMRQRARYGGLLFSLAYLFFPLPCVFAYARMKFEQEAYAEGLKATVELLVMGDQIIQTREWRERHIGYFTQASYFWTWPWRRCIEKWYDHAVKEALGS